MLLHDSMASFEEVFGRCSVAVVSPFNPVDETLDPAALHTLIRHVAGKIIAGQGGIIVTGSTGEQHMMSEAERCSLYVCAVEAADGHAPVIAGVAAFRTGEAVRLAVAARDAGCRGIMLGLPPYIRAGDEELESYVGAVATAIAPLPILLYNNTMRNGGGPSVAAIARMHVRGWIGGVKIVGTTADAIEAEASELAAAAPGLRLYTGSDVLFGELRVKAATSGVEPCLYGLTSILGNVFPESVARLAMGDASDAARVHAALVPLAAACLTGCSLPVGVKCGLREAGIVDPGVARAPLGHVSAGKAAEIRAAVLCARKELARQGLDLPAAGAM